VKKLFLFKIIAIFLIICLGHTQTITMAQFLHQLEQIHPLFEKEVITAQIEIEERNSYLGTQDWHLFSSMLPSHPLLIE